MKYRFHRSIRWNEKFAESPGAIHQTLSNLLFILSEGIDHDATQPPEGNEPASIVKISDARGLGWPGGKVAALGNVMIRYNCPVEYPSHIVLLDLIWYEDDEDGGA